jgi:hypothetical protein
VLALLQASSGLLKKLPWDTLLTAIPTINYLPDSNFQVWSDGDEIAFAPGAMGWAADMWWVMNMTDQPLIVSKALRGEGLKGKFNAPPTVGVVFISSGTRTDDFLPGGYATHSYGLRSAENNLTLRSSIYHWPGPAEPVWSGYHLHNANASFVQYATALLLPPVMGADPQEKGVYVDLELTVRSTQPFYLKGVRLDAGLSARQNNFEPFSNAQSRSNYYYETGVYWGPVVVNAEHYIPGAISIQHKRIIPGIRFWSYDGEEGKISTWEATGSPMVNVMPTNGAAALYADAENMIGLDIFLPVAAGGGIAFRWAADARL